MIRRFKIVFYFIIIFCLIFLLAGCKKSITNENSNLKIKEELNYLDTQIIEIANELNNLKMQNYTITEEEIQKDTLNSNKSQSEDEQNTSNSGSSNNSEDNKTNLTITSMEPQSILENDETAINWNLIKNKIEYLNEAWPVIVIDLTSYDVDNNDILNFSNLLNEIIINVKDERKVEAIKNIAKLYSLLPKFEKQINVDLEEQNLKLAKSYLLNAYCMLDDENWTEIESNISELDEIFKSITNNVEFIKNREFKVNRTYVLIKELQNSLAYKDKKLFLVKYTNLIESINTI